MTTDAAEQPAMTATQVQKILADVAAKDQMARESAPVPGQAVYEQELVPGAKMRRRQNRGLITYDGMPLPDRVTIYNRLTGREKRVSTTLLAKKLAVRDHEGKPKFVSDKPDLPEPEFIKEACEVCIRRGVRKRFIHKWDYVGHMEIKHPREWRIMEEERREQEAITPEALAKAIANLDPATKRALFGQEAQNGNQEDLEAATCTVCGWQGKPVKDAEASLRTHTKLHCPGGITTGEPDISVSE